MRGRHFEEVPNMVACLGNFWYFGKLFTEGRWSVIQEVVTTGGSTVITVNYY